MFAGQIPVFDAEFPSQTQSPARLRKGPRGRTQLPMPRDIHGTPALWHGRCTNLLPNESTCRIHWDTMGYNGIWKIYGGFLKMVVSKNGWFIRENLIKIDDLGGPPF